MKKLIVNADDFGLHPCVNEAIMRGHQNGIITSTSLMPTGQFFNEAVDIAKKLPELGIGIHLTLVAERPFLPAAEVSTLLQEDGSFYTDYTRFIAKYFSGNVSADEIRRELTAQVGYAMQTGLNITHIDSHQHLHVLPGIIDMVIDLAEKYKISAIRKPAEAYLFTGGYRADMKRVIGKCGLTMLSRRAAAKAHRHGIKTPDAFFGMLAGGHLNKEYLSNMLDSMSDGVSEIMLHPGTDNAVLQEKYGWGYHWQDELAAVMSEEIKTKLEHDKIQLKSFGAFAYE